MFTSPELEVATRAARRAARVLCRHFRNGAAIRHKQSYDLVTDADLESEQIIIRTIRDAFPDHDVLAEESGSSIAGRDNLWVIDPLDGTSNFVHGIDHFAISIAWYREGQAELGVVLRPASEDWFVAGRNKGAWRNGSPASTSAATSLTEVLLGVGFFYDRATRMEATLAAMQTLFHRDIRGFRRMGTASLDLCMVGCGQLGGYFEFQLAPWDFSAGLLFVREAGGRVTDCAGDEVPLQHSSILASNEHLHDELLQLIGPAWTSIP